MTGEENPPMAERESVAGNPLLHSIDDACRRLSMGRSWLYAEIAAGNVKVAKLGRRTLIPESELRRIARQAVLTGWPQPRTPPKTGIASGGGRGWQDVSFLVGAG